MDSELMERVAQEEREWAAARLHHQLHGTWLPTDECPTCLQDAELTQAVALLVEDES